MVENSEMVREVCGEPTNGSELTKLMTVCHLLIKSAETTYDDNGEQKLDFESIGVSHVGQLIESIHCIEPRLAVQVAISLH